MSQHGETLHNLNADGVLEEGRLLLCDAGGETVEGYCSDHTRTYPVSGRFTQKQKDIYNIVLAAHDHVARIVKPHMMYTEVHNAAYMTLAEGLVGLGLLKGPAADAVAAGAMTARRWARGRSTTARSPNGPPSREPASTARRGGSNRGP